MAAEGISEAFSRVLRREFTDFRAMTGLVTRLPVGAVRPELPRALAALPLAGLVVGAAGGIVLWILSAIGLPALVCAAGATATLIWFTGALHEDGLADTIDGFGGGADPSAKLEIMRDSRIGTYGVAALSLSIILRIALAATITETAGPLVGALGLIAAGGVSRAAAVHALWALPPVRDDGLGRAAGRPDRDVMARLAIGLSAAAIILIVPGFGLAGLFAALLAVAIATLLVERLALRHIGGQTGDVCGAVQQFSEISCLAGLAIVLS